MRGLFPCHSGLKAQNIKASNATPTGKGDAGQLDSLIRQLGSLDFTQREKATEELEANGCAALEVLRKAARRDKDPEVRQRATRVVQRLENRLDGLLADYRAFGMPFPPSDAKLVRFVAQQGERIDGKWVQEKYRFGFLTKPRRGVEPATVLAEMEQGELNWDIKARVLDPDKMTIREIEDLRHQGDSSGGEGLAFAIHCKARGWDKLARAVLDEWEKVDEEERSPHTKLVQKAWEYWCAQLYEPGTDWRTIAGRLKGVTAADGSLDNAPNRALVRSLDLALVPSQAKPGSVAALIDRLIDCRTTYSGLDVRSPTFQLDPKYQDVLHQGEAAVPELIKHLDDDRLTRTYLLGFNNFFGYQCRIKHLVSDLLEDIAGKELRRDGLERVIGYTVKKEKALAWWEKKRKMQQK
ncbi:MAG TPA: hypothetical protein VG099_11155 [Gemmataceae bacterium]|nr:hypothetical protein [Gemmataceae bacterium]